MILDRKYRNDGIYTLFDFRSYQLVFEHNFSASTNCFRDIDEAKNANTVGKLSILYDLNNPKYIMKDSFRHFIIEYPELKYINAWKQKYSPTEEWEVPNRYAATGFVAQITEIKMDEWGGLVRTHIPDGTVNAVCNYLDGNPGRNTWFFSIGMLCNAPSDRKYVALPANNVTGVKRVSLWSAIKNYSIKYSCICSIYNTFSFEYLTLIFICA